MNHECPTVGPIAATKPRREGTPAPDHALFWRRAALSPPGWLLLLALWLAVPHTATAAGVVGTGTPESCTEAALDAALVGGGLVAFDCGAEPVTITITSTKTIAADTSIDGGGGVTIDGNHNVRVYKVNSGIRFTVQNLTIANGNSGDDVSGGGGILCDSGCALAITNSTLTGNAAKWGGGILGYGTLAVVCSTISDNSAGGVEWIFGDILVTDSTISGNGGGGISAGFSNITGGCGGGRLTLANSTVSGNEASPGAPITIFGTAAITNSTIAGNSAAAQGASIAHKACGGHLTLANTIIAGSAPSGDCITDTVATGGHNIIEDPDHACGLTNGLDGNLVGVDPLLDPAGLANNGGPTQTIALLAGSPAINAGDPEVCANPPVNGVDQRGYVRPGTGSTNCSIGAFEYDSPGPPPASCIGDCNGDGEVTVAELIIMVNIALGSAPVTACTAGDANGDGAITIDEIIRAVNAALSGCPPGMCGGIAGLPCRSGEVCDLRDPTCAVADLAGVCVPRPDACPEFYDPVCGCDGVTYANECFRLAAGATLAHAGACP